MADQPLDMPTSTQLPTTAMATETSAPVEESTISNCGSPIVTAQAVPTAASPSPTEPVSLKRKSGSLAQLLEAYTDCSDDDATSDEDSSSSSSEDQVDGGEVEELNDNDDDDDDDDDEEIEVEEGEEEEPASTDDENETSSDENSPKTEPPVKDIIAVQTVREINPTPPVDPPTETSQQKRKNHASKSLAADLGLDILPAVEKLKISVKENECMPVGQVHSIVDRLVVVESIEKTPALDFDTILFDSAGRAIGQVFDIFGQVKRPYYTIRFNSREDIDKTGLTVGSLTYCAPKTEFTKYVFTQQLLKEKGSDASWKNDQEVPEKFKDYSDDEEERCAKRGGKAKGRETVLEEEPESPSRKKHLSFERQMNWNNTYRNRVCKRRADEERVQKSNWDVGWHNYCFPMPPPVRPVGYGRGGTPGSMTLKQESALAQHQPPPPPPPVSSQPAQSHLPDYVTAAAAGFPPSMSHPPPPPPPVVTNNWYCRPCDQPPPPPPPRPYQQPGHHFLHHGVPPPPSFPFPPPPPPTTATCPVGVYPPPSQPSAAPPPSYSQVMSSASSPMSANSGVFLHRYPPPPPGPPQQRLYYNPFM